MNKPHPWTSRVHAALMASGQAVTSSQALGMFGRPEGRLDAQGRLSRGVWNGFFNVTQTEEGYVYTAIKRIEPVRSRVWRDEMVELLKREWPKHGNDCAHLFPEVSARAVRSKAEKLKLHRDRSEGGMAGRKPKGGAINEPMSRREMAAAMSPKSRDGIPFVASVWQYAERVAA